MPLGNSRKDLNHSSLQLPKSSISAQLSAPQIVPQMAMVTISKSLCRLVRSILNQSQGGNYILERWQRHGRCKHQCVGSGL